MRYEAYFFTATILEWKRLLKPGKYKDIILSSLRFLVANGRVNVHGFVIMDNHIHILWSIVYPHKLMNVQRDFLKYTAHQIKFDLIDKHPQVLEYFLVNAKDRRYQIWERNSLSIELRNESVLLQKLEYIHQNPVKAGLCIEPENYYYSSAMFYGTGENDFGFLSHYRYD
ncbi:REP-associated tyrosine transposase [Chitinophagaceae bacterium MMS25-I14]